ncbi:MAG: hypothetical protein MK107_11590, partial [Oceanicola sp.]|nr:hypothetical protein [Oceanicola sp.]
MQKTMKNDVVLKAKADQNYVSLMLRGGRMTKVAGVAASYAPCLGRVRTALSTGAIVLSAAMALPTIAETQVADGCTINGGVVACAGNDTNGLFIEGDVLDVTVISGATVDDTATDQYPVRSAIKILGNVDGSVINNGTITSKGGPYSDADGVEVDEIFGDFTNSGKITATATGNSRVDTVETENILGSFENSGTITAMATADSRANTVD